MILLTETNPENQKSKLAEGLKKLSADNLRELLFLEEVLIYAQSGSRSGHDNNLGYNFTACSE